jgi:uncharacterized protein with HEPN domain
MPRSEAQRRQDMREAYDRITSFISGMDFDAFANDQRTIRAVLYDLMVLGEAAKSVSEATRGRYPGIPWRQVAGMNDIAAHQYHGIMVDLLWDTASTRVPAVRRELG